MSMLIKNNPQAMMALRETNKNTANAAKDLKKLSSGAKIAGAGDDASGYAISEKMRVQIRSLNQDEQNVKNGKSLLRVAAGGIDNIVDELRNLKELAINAANDTNTDDDRATIQKEFDNRMANIDDIASTTNYNGRILLNGDYWRYSTQWGEVLVPGDPYTITRVVGRKWEKIGTNPPVGREVDPNAKIQNMVSQFSSANGATSVIPAYRAYDSVEQFKDCSKVFTNKRIGKGREMNPPFDECVAVKIDFSGMSKVGGGAITIPDDLDGEGFSILCSACSTQYVTIVFDANTDDSSYDHKNPNHVDAMTYTIGIKSVTTFDELEDALFNGIKNAPGRPTNADNWQETGGDAQWKEWCEPDTADSIIIDIQHNLRIQKNPSGDGYVFRKGTSFAPDMGFYDLGKVKDVFGTGENPPEDIYGWVDVTEDVTVWRLIRSEGWIDTPGNPLVIQTGTKANQSVNVYINDMHIDALGLRNTLVTTRQYANYAIEDVDNALEYALGEATYVGSYISRLDFTEDNIVTASENTQAAESTIRDADMAREAMNYARDNILSQSAQSMLAQANQNSSSVLSLLQ